MQYFGFYPFAFCLATSHQTQFLHWIWVHCMAQVPQRATKITERTKGSVQKSVSGKIIFGTIQSRSAQVTAGENISSAVHAEGTPTLASDSLMSL